MVPNYPELEKLLLGMADKTRLRLLGLMASGPVSVGHLVEKTGESQPKVSRHLAYLRNAGLVDTRRDGKWIYYGIARLDDPSADAVLRCVVGELAAAADGPAHITVTDEPDIPEHEWEEPSIAPREDLDVHLL